MSFAIDLIHGRWVLDSRGNPTVELDAVADLVLEKGEEGVAVRVREGFHLVPAMIRAA